MSINKLTSLLRLACIGVILISLVSVIFLPQASFGPVQRALIFLFGGIFAGVLVGGDVANHFEYTGKQFVFTLVGSAATSFAIGAALWWATKPKEVTVAFDVVDEQGSPVLIAPDGAVVITPMRGARQSYEPLRKGSMFVVTLDDDETEIHVSIADPSGLRGRSQGVIGNPETGRARLQVKSGRVSVVRRAGGTP